MGEIRIALLGRGAMGRTLERDVASIDGARPAACGGVTARAARLAGQEMGAPAHADPAASAARSSEMRDRA